MYLYHIEKKYYSLKYLLLKVIHTTHKKSLSVVCSL